MTRPGTRSLWMPGEWTLRIWLPLLAIGAIVPLVLADGPADNLPDKVRPIPPVGVEVAAEDRDALEAGLAKLDEAIAALRARQDARTGSLLPDVEIFARAVRQGVAYQEFFSPADVQNAKQVLAEGQARADQLLSGKAPWLEARGLVVRGYRSRIDQTVQPYGLVIPESYRSDTPARYRLDLWFHGRGETLSEPVFIHQRMTQAGPIAPVDTIVLHPYGRYSNANKFAGEIDTLEALEHARKFYRVDDDRIAARGFSMGGAAAWQFAVHYPDRWFAANPGAGFSETPEFLKSFQKETLDPTWFERKLWRWYDATDYAINLFHLPTIAYSGELDVQKQAADIMERALAKESLRLAHLIGPDTKHALHPGVQMEIEQRLASLARRTRDPVPRELHFATYTLKYHRMHWLTVTGMGEHWELARVDGQIQAEEQRVRLQTRNVTSLELAIPAGHSPFSLRQPVTIVIDGVTVKADRPETDGTWRVALVRDQESWKTGRPTNPKRKRPNLQGPIDDAMMDSFLVVKPTGKARHARVDQWSRDELAHFVEHWRRQFRGDAVVKDDTSITDEDIASANLILFGDPASNALIQKIIDRLPVLWSDATVSVGSQKFPADEHALIMIYPNPLNPNRYVVLNSGFTYREFAYLNNARQVPKLPDWAIVDLKTPPDSLWPGKIVAADFFGEAWDVRPPRE